MRFPDQASAFQRPRPLQRARYQANVPRVYDTSRRWAATATPRGLVGAVKSRWSKAGSPPRGESVDDRFPGCVHERATRWSGEQRAQCCSLAMPSSGVTLVGTGPRGRLQSVPGSPPRTFPSISFFQKKRKKRHEPKATLCLFPPSSVQCPLSSSPAASTNAPSRGQVHAGPDIKVGFTSPILPHLPSLAVDPGILCGFTLPGAWPG